MEALPLIATIGSTVLSASGSMQAGNAQNTAARYQAAQMEQQAGQERAAAQREAMEERRRARLTQSRALAVAGASGAGASDPTVLDVMGDIASEGEYRALTAMFNGEERARGLEMGGQAKRFEGATAKQAGKVQAASTLLSSGSTLYDRFG